MLDYFLNKYKKRLYISNCNNNNVNITRCDCCIIENSWDLPICEITDAILIITLLILNCNDQNVNINANN